MSSSSLQILERIDAAALAPYALVAGVAVILLLWLKCMADEVRFALTPSIEVPLKPGAWALGGG